MNDHSHHPHHLAPPPGCYDLALQMVGLIVQFIHVPSMKPDQLQVLL